MDLNWWRVRFSWRHPRRHHAPPNAERYRYAVINGMAGWFSTDDMKRLGLLSYDPADLMRMDSLVPKPGQALRFLPRLRRVDNGW